MIVTLNGFKNAFGLVCADSIICQKFHYGYLQDLNAANRNETPNDTTDYPLFLLTPPRSGEIERIGNSHNYNIPFVAYMWATEFYFNNGTPDPLHTMEDYNQQLQVACDQIIKRVDKALYNILEGVRFEFRSGQLNERLIGVQASFTARISAPYGLDTMRGDLTNAAIIAIASEGSDPTQLLDITQTP